MSNSEFRSIRISDFDYDLPEAYVAQKPLKLREESKLLVFRNHKITHTGFNSIGTHIPDSALLVFNNTRVIPARLFATKETGARIQIFLLNPVSPFAEVERALKVTESAVVWKCMIGNAKRWKEGEQLQIDADGFRLLLTLINKEEKLVEFAWSEPIEFCDVIEAIGNMPLPPYIKREAQEEDSSRYQTVYARNDGAVAAPTAGLHFSKNLLDELQSKGVKTTELTLHVGAGTFKPVETDVVWDHPMHEEFFQVGVDCLETLLLHKLRIATGTTSLRTLETLYWVGVQLAEGVDNPFLVTQHKPYEYAGEELSFEDAIGEILRYTKQRGLSEVVGTSGIMIMPGYDIKSVQGLITNFHLPKSTLLLLISAMVGNDWRSIYDEAKKHDYRFLSYGDSSLLWKD